MLQVAVNNYITTGEKMAAYIELENHVNAASVEYAYRRCQTINRLPMLGLGPQKPEIQSF